MFEFKALNMYPDAKPFDRWELCIHDFKISMQCKTI